MNKYFIAKIKMVKILMAKLSMAKLIHILWQNQPWLS